MDATPQIVTQEQTTQFRDPTSLHMKKLKLKRETSCLLLQQEINPQVVSLCAPHDRNAH